MDSFPFQLYIEQFVLNDVNFIKVNRTDVNMYGICLHNDSGIYIMIVNNIPYIIKRTQDNLELYFSYDGNVVYSINQHNKYNSSNDENIINLFILTQTIDISHIKEKYSCCNIEYKESNLSIPKNNINEINETLHKHCHNMYLQLDHGYNMGNIVFFDEELTILDYMNRIFLCLKINNICVSSIQYKITNVEAIYEETNIDEEDEIDEIPDGSLCLSITSKTLKKYEGNNYNKFLRVITMLIAPTFGVQYVHSDAGNPISLLLMNKIFDNNIFDNKFDDFITQYKNVDKFTNFDILKKYYANPNTQVQIFSQLNDINTSKSRLLFSELITKICRYNGAGGGIKNVQHKSAKYMHKIHKKYSDMYFEKLIFWNTVKMTQDSKL